MLIRSSILVAFLLSSILTSFDINAQSPDKEQNINTVRVVSPAWSKFTNTDGTGLYFDLVKLIYESQQTIITTELVPWARGVKYIKDNKADLLLGNTRSDGGLQTKYPLDVEKIVAISKKNSQQSWVGPTSLTNKIVGFIRGYDFLDKMPVKVKSYNFEYPKQGWGMLDNDRIEYYIENHTDALIRLKEKNIDANNYNFHRLWEEVLIIKFQDSPRGQALADIYDKRYPIIHADGSLESIYKKYNIPYIDPLLLNLTGLERAM